MQIRKVEDKLLEYKRSSYVMDKSLVWFFYKYLEYKKTLEIYKKLPKFYGLNNEEKIRQLNKQLMEMQLGTLLMTLEMDLFDEWNIIFFEQTSYGEKVKISNKEEDLKLRKKLMEEIELEKTELKEIVGEDNELQRLKEENQYLRKRIIKLGG